MITVMIVDDHTVLRDGLKSIFEMENDITVIGEAESGEAALTLVPELKPDVIIMDINLPEQNGVAITRQLKNDFKEIKILMLTMHSHEEYFMSAIREGADGYLLKDAPSDQVVEAIRTVMRGEAVIHPSMTKKLLNFISSKALQQKRQSCLNVRRKCLPVLSKG